MYSSTGWLEGRGGGFFTRGRKEFVEAGMNFGVRGSGVRGVRMSGPVVVLLEVTGEDEEIIK